MKERKMYGRRWMAAMCVIGLLCLVGGCKEKRGELKRIWYNGSYNRDFNDLNAS